MILSHFHIIFSPLLPLTVLTTLAILAALMLGFALYRRARGGWLRALLFALLLLALANPSLIGETREPLKDKALLVIDDSASMALGNRAQQVKEAADAIAQKLAGFSDLDVETVHVAGEDETDLFRAIEQKRGEIPSDRLAGIIALTDGQIHDLPAGDYAAPFHALLAGQKGEIDRRISIKAAARYAIVGQKAAVTLRVDDDPKPQSEEAIVTITHDDGKRDTLHVPVGKDVEVTTDITHPGANQLAFEVEALPHELTALNNVALARINGIHDRLRVLLVSGQPNVGGRQWLNLLKGDAAIDIVNFTILRSPLKNNAVPNKELSLIAFPARDLFETKLRLFDLVIFDGFSNRLLVPETYLANIADYVQSGGALLVSNATGGQATELGRSALAKILPVATDGEALSGRFVPALSEAGLRHPVTATLDDAMPHHLWSPWYRQIDGRVVNNDSEILMTGLGEKPLLVLAHVGEGRVAQFLSNQFWLWSREYPNGGPETEMLRRTAHWLMKEPELDETALKAEAEKTAEGWQLHISKQSLSETEAKVIVTGPDEQPLQVTLATDAKTGTLQATTPAKQPGLYHVKDDTHDVMVLAGIANTPEFGAMAATETILAPIARNSGGSIHWLGDVSPAPDIRRVGAHASTHGSGWIGLRQNGQYRITGSEAYPLWPAWAALAVLLIFAMLGWRREGN